MIKHTDVRRAKIEIKGPIEDLQRISIFLKNNHINHRVVDGVHDNSMQRELENAIDWPL